MKQKKHIFFDLDDTLWDFETNSSAVLVDLFRQHELSKKLNTDFSTFLEEYKRVNLLFWSRYNRREIDKAYLRNHRFNETFKKFNYDNYLENIELTEKYLERAPHGKALKKDCAEVLAYLQKNYNLHIITNGFKEIQGTKLDGCGLRGFFKEIIISEDYPFSKPDERIFRLAESLTNSSREDCVMIGDNFESDIQGALQAGWDAIHFSENRLMEYKGTHITQLKQLKELF